ncbi:MAG: putative DNA binding domain-containing protein [Succinivibrionaceae bacterium]|jgi:predicted HTH transcriptional regulator|nr:putative DNA binding domain-containing protein [Lachnospiraceae bacterium]MDY6274532.1 putative DNA binding domain-containing protein [Succinivibrionaceae bacterium]MDY6336267.1 putative DNA binding domain-containing protein [Succinivibrionaceae bacterium]
MIYYESEIVELKESVNETLAKEMVAFLNSFGGTIYIGVTDKGIVKGVNNVDKSFRQISDVITDSIEPSPVGLIEPAFTYDKEKPLIRITVKKGLRPLYCIKKHGYSPAGCFLRIGATCKSMSADEIQRRYVQNLANTDLMISSVGNTGILSFNTLKNYYYENGYHIEDESFEDNLKLHTTDGHYNKLAELMSDSNMVPVIVVKFQGKDKTSISQRNDYGGGCLLFTYEKIRNRFMSENICKSDTTVRPRRDRYLFDMSAVTEAIVNAFVHNDWTKSQPLFCIFKDRLEIFSHGGLPAGQTKEDFFKGISCPRNDALMRIFNNMHISEHTGHGIPLIVRKYGKKAFDITDDHINVTIPFDQEVLKSVGNNVGNRVGNKAESSVINSAGNNEGSYIRDDKIENAIIALILKDQKVSAKKISEKLGVTSRTVERIISRLKNQGVLERINGTRGYWLVKK